MVSVNTAPATSEEVLSTKIIQNQMSVTTRAQIEATGAKIIPRGNNLNPYHAEIHGITEEDANRLFNDKKQNPTPKADRINFCKK